MNNKKIIYALLIVVVVALTALLLTRHYRYDLTADKRYSLSPATSAMLSKLNKNVEVTIYLDGDLNSGFAGLKNATADILDEMALKAGKGLIYKFVNPSQADDDKQRQQNYETLAQRGLQPTVIYDHDDQGNSRQILVFPWAEVNFGGKTVPVSLLKNIRGNSGEENLNASIETLEYEFADALRFLTRREVRHVAFLEGHGELPEAYTYDLSLALSRYFQVDRGSLGYDAAVLDNFEAVIIADPQKPFSERDKYIIDQYIMRGGKVLWLLSGVKFDFGALSTEGLTPAIAHDLNLTDMLFHYGIRVNAGLLQDEQCLPVPVNMAQPGENPNYQPVPWHYQPLLLPSPLHPATNHIGQVVARFPTTIDFVGDGTDVSAQLLLVSSQAARIIATPAKVDLQPQQIDQTTFTASFLPVAASIEGNFNSAFTHRIKPDSIVNAGNFIAKSVATKQVVVACGNVARNELQNGQPLPLGYDRYTQNQFGNRDFLLNTILYLTDQQGWINLRQKHVTLRLLNPTAVRYYKTQIMVATLIIPLLLLALFGGLYNIVRIMKLRR